MGRDDRHRLNRLPVNQQLTVGHQPHVAEKHPCVRSGEMSPDDAETHNAALSTGDTAPGVSALGTSVAVHSLTATSRLGRGVRCG